MHDPSIKYSLKIKVWYDALEMHTDEVHAIKLKSLHETFRNKRPSYENRFVAQNS
jgi:hypothetical protein